MASTTAASSKVEISQDLAAQPQTAYTKEYGHLARPMDLAPTTGILGTSVLMAGPEVTAAWRAGLLRVSSGDAYCLTPKGLLLASQLRLAPDVVNWEEARVENWVEK